MAFPLRKVMKDEPPQLVAAKGILSHDWPAVTPCQRECTARLGMSIQIEQEAYLLQHPEIGAMLQTFISKTTSDQKRKTDILKQTADFFLRNPEEIDKEIRERLNLPPEGPYIKSDQRVFYYQDKDLITDLRNITSKYFPSDPWKIPTPEVITPDTLSSSFLSVVTSASTLPTPEPVASPEPTLSETMLNLVSNTVDKAIYLQVDDQTLRYDTAYVELSKAVEEAMEIPVIQIREDIYDLIYNAYKMFEITIIENERIAAEIAWEKRMRKKMKRSLRREINFKGYESPPTPKSEISSHESYRKPPPRPCKCHPQWNYNRHGKDRFGIYLPRDEKYEGNNVTVTPIISSENIPDETM